MLDGKGKVLCFDCEARGLLDSIHTRKDLHVIHVIDAATQESYVFFDDYEDRSEPKCDLGEWEVVKAGNLEDGAMFLLEAECVIGQNTSGFDWHVFEKVFPTLMKDYDYFKRTGDSKHPFKCMDTFVMSSLLNPERKPPKEAYELGCGNVGANSIEAHGIRIGRYKPHHEDWSILTTDMLHRCHEDVEIGIDFYYWLMREWEEQLATPNKKTGYTIEDAYYCEHRIAFSIARQALRGFALDVSLIGEYMYQWDKELDEIENKFKPFMPKRLVKTKAKYSATQLRFLEANLDKKSMFEIVSQEYTSSSATIWTLTTKATKAGEAITKAVSKHYPTMVGFKADYGKEWATALVGGAFTPITYEDVPIGNRDAVKQVLYKAGWLGVNLNETELAHEEQYNKLIGSKKHSLIKQAKAMGALPYPWSGKIDEASMEAWRERDGSIPEWAELVARWYIVASRRNQLCNREDPKAYLEKGRWISRGGKAWCRGILPRAICQDTGMTAQEYFERYGMFPDSGHWRIPASAVTIGTPTFRMRHRNVVNIPTRGIYGHEMRRIFTHADGKKLVGCDASGLELRCLAHFMNDDEYTDMVLNGDIHTYNQNKAGLPTRDNAKTMIYALLYGSGVSNLARVCNLPIPQMEICIDSFKKELPALDSLITGVQKVGGSRGYLLAIDGRRGQLRKKDGEYSTHIALNLLLQMTGSIIMKWAHVLAEDLAVEKGIIKSIRDFPNVVHYHDEAGFEDNASSTLDYYYNIPKCEWKEEEKAGYIDEQGRVYSAPVIDGEEGDQLLLHRTYSPLGEVYAEAIKLAGDKFNLRCPTAGEYKVGDTWEDTH